ncbi:unknown [Prevotella sp. CAG:924]|nr:unknown [Prevotella sp. CAG:924]
MKGNFTEKNNRCNSRKDVFCDFSVSTERYFSCFYSKTTVLLEK